MDFKYSLIVLEIDRWIQKPIERVLRDPESVSMREVVEREISGFLIEWENDYVVLSE